MAPALCSQRRDYTAIQYSLVSQLGGRIDKILPNKKNFSGTTDVQECSNHYNVMLGHIFSKDTQAFINQRLKEGMVKSDALQTYQAYLEKVESEETQPFRGGGGARLQTRKS